MASLLSPLGLLLWFGWNLAVISSIQLTVRLIRAYSVRTTLLAAAALTAGSLPIAFFYVQVLGRAFAWYPLAMALTAPLGFAVAAAVLHLKRLRARLAAAVGAALLSGPWPVFLG